MGVCYFYLSHLDQVNATRSFTSDTVLDECRIGSHGLGSLAGDIAALVVQSAHTFVTSVNFKFCRTSTAQRTFLVDP